MTCPFCQASAFNRADIVIGFHGAGLANMIYLKPGSVVAELVYDYDSRHLPVIGIFPRVSDIIGLHHLVYYTKDVGLNLKQIAQEVQQFVTEVKA